jgi:hypothetical protein
MSEMTLPAVKSFRRTAMDFCGNTYLSVCFKQVVPCNGAGKTVFRRSLHGFSLIEMIVTLTMALIVTLAAGVLLVAGNRVWYQTFHSVHKQIKQDAQAVMLTFGKVGRKSNRIDYRIYKKDGDFFTPVLPEKMDTVEVVSGDAVEFRYWDVELDATDSHNLIDTSKTATAYALFYLDGDNLMVDYGPYPPGGVPEGGGLRNTSDIITSVLAENVSTDDTIGAFSHTVENGVGMGCVRINIILTDPDDGEQMKVMTATMMRNIWPR